MIKDGLIEKICEDGKEYKIDLEKIVENNKKDLLKIYKDYKENEETERTKIDSKDNALEFVFKHSEEFNGLLIEHFNININNFIKEIEKNLISKISRMHKIEKTRGTMSDENVLENIECAFKSAYYMHFRYLYNNRVELEINDEFYCAIFYFIREYCYASMFRYNVNGKFNVPYGGISYKRKSYIPDFLEQKAKLNHGEVEKVVVEGRHEPIISNEDFERVQKMIKVRCNNNVGAGIPKNVWSKKLKCECGSSFNKRLYHKKDTGNTYCFQCYHQKTYGSLNNRIKRGLPTDDVFDVPLVQDWKLYIMANFLFKKIWSDKDKIKEVINKLLDEVITDKETCNDLENEINNINVKINANNNKLKNLLDMVLNEYINKEEYKTKKEEIEKNNELLENQKMEKENKYGIPKDSLKERIKNIKKSR